MHKKIQLLLLQRINMHINKFFLTIFTLSSVLNAMELDRENFKLNNFDMLPDDMVGSIANELVNVSHKFNNNNESTSFDNCRSFLLTCKRFKEIGREKFINNDLVLDCLVNEYRKTFSDYSSRQKCKQPTRRFELKMLTAAKLNSKYWINNALKTNKDAIHALDPYRKTPLHIAAQYNSCDVATLFINNGARMNDKDAHHNTPLHTSIRSNSLKVTRLLINNGVDVNEEAQTLTPLHLTTYNDAVDVAKLLIINGANANTQNCKRTPLHAAVLHDAIGVAKLLIDNGAHVNELDLVENCTPLDLAISRNNQPFIKLLIDNGAKTNEEILEIIAKP